MSCPRCSHKLNDEQKVAFKERQKQIELAASRGEEHLGSEAAKIIIKRKASKLDLQEKQKALN